MRKKIFSILLSFAMVIVMMPTIAMTSFATDSQQAAEVKSEKQVVMLKAKVSGKTAVKPNDRLFYTILDRGGWLFLYNKLYKFFKLLEV